MSPGKYGVPLYRCFPGWNGPYRTPVHMTMHAFRRLFCTLPANKACNAILGLESVEPPTEPFQLCPSHIPWPGLARAEHQQKRELRVPLPFAPSLWGKQQGSSLSVGSSSSSSSSSRCYWRSSVDVEILPILSFELWSMKKDSVVKWHLLVLFSSMWRRSMR